MYEIWRRCVLLLFYRVFHVRPITGMATTCLTAESLHYGLALHKWYTCRRCQAYIPYLQPLLLPNHPLFLVDSLNSSIQLFTACLPFLLDAKHRGLVSHAIHFVHWLASLALCPASSARCLAAPALCLASFSRFTASPAFCLASFARFTASSAFCLAAFARFAASSAFYLASFARFTASSAFSLASFSRFTASPAHCSLTSYDCYPASPSRCLTAHARLLASIARFTTSLSV